MFREMLLSQPLAARGLGLWGHQGSPLAWTSASPQGCNQGGMEGGGVFPQVALWPLENSRTGADKYGRWPVVTVTDRLVWEQ